MNINYILTKSDWVIAMSRLALAQNFKQTYNKLWVTYVMRQNFTSPSTSHEKLTKIFKFTKIFTKNLFENILYTISYFGQNKKL